MTMHLVNGMSTVRTTKPKTTKLTKAKREELGRALAEYNRELKQQGRHHERMTFDEYVDYLHGKPRKVTPKEPVATRPNTYRRETAKYPSLDSDPGVALKKEPQKYTGTLVKGISTMHKSNAVPIINDEQATEIARMRRG